MVQQLINKRMRLITIIFLLACLQSFAQPKTYSTSNTKAIKLYDDAMNMLQSRQDEKAMQLLDKALEKDNAFVEVHALKAEIYAYKGEYSKAIDAYNASFKINPTFFPNNFYYAARLEMRAGKYTEAKEHFQNYIDAKNVTHKFDDDAKIGVQSCEFAIKSIANPKPFNPINMGAEVNTEYDEYFPSITADDQLFLFTRRLPVAGGSQQNMSAWQEDFFVTTKQNNKWNPSRSVGQGINTETNEGAPCLSQDGQYLFFVVCADMYGYGLERKGYGSCDIFVSRKAGDKWLKANNVGTPVNSKNWESQPSFSSDGKTLYFIRGITDEEGLRNGDIWMAQIQADGKWGAATKLSNKINTAKSEESVFIHPDNQTLYFSSNGRVGMGGMDIYMSKRQPDGEWGEPVNLGYPINTYNDENSLLVDSKGALAYFASNREGGMGGLDIYHFELNKEFKPEQVTYFKGKVYDAKTKKPLQAAFELVDLETGKIAIESQSNQTSGEFLVCLSGNKNYALNVSRSGYLFYSENFSLKESKDASKPFFADVPLQPIDTGISMQLKNVFFETNKFDLKKESKIELDKLIAFLNTNATLKIELSGHTDNVGDKKANLTLSQNRAKAVFDYLVKGGIVAERLTHKGYGDTKPIAPNDTPENKQKNRRTEFKITAK